MTIQTNSDELERQKFEDWFKSKFLERIKSYPRMEKSDTRILQKLLGLLEASRRKSDITATIRSPRIRAGLQHQEGFVWRVRLQTDRKAMAMV